MAVCREQSTILVITGSSVFMCSLIIQVGMGSREQDLDDEEEIGLKISSLLAGETHSKDNEVCKFMFIEDGLEKVGAQASRF